MGVSSLLLDCRSSVVHHSVCNRKGANIAMRNHVTLYHTYINQDLFSAVTVSLTCSRTFSTSICDQQSLFTDCEVNFKVKGSRHFYLSLQAFARRGVIIAVVMCSNRLLNDVQRRVFSCDLLSCQLTSAKRLLNKPNLINVLVGRAWNVWLCKLNRPGLRPVWSMLPSTDR